MKKIFVLILTVLLISTACTPRAPQERPIYPNENLKMQDLENQDLETDQSSIFELGKVKNIRITANVTDVKDGAGNKFKNVGNLTKNDVVKVLDQVGDWYVVRLDNNQVGCVDASNATPIVKEGEDYESNQVRQPAPSQKPTPSQVTDKPNNKPEPQNDQNKATPTQTGVNQLSNQEQQMVNLVNQERSKNSLKPLTVDLELARVAEVKSQDMVDNNYFSHNSPNYGSPFDMMKSFGIDYLAAGENLAGNNTVQKAHTALMNSSGHRKNILSPDFTHIGIGIRPSDKYGYIFTQMFISKPK